MSYDLKNKLVIGLSSSALFDLKDSDKIFREHGEKVYREYQRQHQENPLKKGVAFSFIRRILTLNQLQKSEPLVEVILLSRNDPDTGLRVMNSIEHYKLNITRAMFLQGKPPYVYIPAFDIELFLSANSQDVTQAVNAGYPAGLILSGNFTDDINDHELRIAFDFDGVLADDEAETIYKTSGKIQAFHTHESEKANIPHNPGPLKKFLDRISQIQKIEMDHLTKDPLYKSVLKISIVTARNAPSHKRVINTMRTWGIDVNEAFFMGGIEKSNVLNILKPHIFFDDQRTHLEKPSSTLPSVHIPFGIANKVDTK
ncbi:5'-nucleotidase [Thalassospira marina]|uniref:5'-nucleotidase n=1 Tax=Thalassospira marina TaxID=2048283 RepID=A0ABN5FIM8_9PROT|nr:5'-nucleotidase [Thalassospira marina]AUG53167.1 5'-nucleotidase [Thalassospira marina]